MTCIIYLVLALGFFLLTGSEIAVLFAFIIAPVMFLVSLVLSMWMPRLTHRRAPHDSVVARLPDGPAKQRQDLRRLDD